MYSETPLTWWSKVDDDAVTRTIILVLLTLVLLGYLFPDRIMDLVDAYTELPSFADLPWILKDRFRGFARRGLRMQPTLVLRPFAQANVLTPRHSASIASGAISSLGFWRNSAEGEDSNDVAPQAGMSLSDRFKGRRWDTSDDESSARPLKVPGLVNTGNFCFMNSVLQALASLPEFNTYLDTIDEGADTTPIAATVAELLRLLNTPRSFATALHPDEVARALMQRDKHRLLATREQQDAQEFFTLLIDALEAESARQWLVVNKPVGLESISDLSPATSRAPSTRGVSLKTMSTQDTHAPSPFEGLSAHRMGCLKCKYVENIRHEKFGPTVLPLNAQQSTTLEECLKETFKMEVLEDVECQRCTLLAYRINLSRIINTLSSPQQSSPALTNALTNAKNRLEAIDRALESGKIEDPKLLAPAGGEKEIKKFLQHSPKTKHHMIARPPRLLAFHIQRSSFHNYTGRALKNQSPVSFPVTLDMSEYVTNSTLSMDPEEPISKWIPGDPRTIYRLRSVVVHYGLHHMGHYVAYRYAEGGWYRISDEDVESSTLDEVLTEGARGVFMLMYELVQPDISEPISEGDVSTTPTVQTLDTVAESPEASTLPEDEPVVIQSADIDSLTEDSSLTSTESHPSFRLDPIPSTKNDPSLLDIVESRLEKIKISPSSSVASTEDDSLHHDDKSRSTSFSSTHSRPQTPIFENKDLQLSPPPRKKMKKDTAETTEGDNALGLDMEGIH